MEAVEQPVVIVNMSAICRLCLSEEGVGVPIFGGDEDSPQAGAPLSARIMTCASLEVHAGDGLPGLICLRCMYQVDQSYKFRVQCQRSDAALRKHFNVKSVSHHNVHRIQERRLTESPATVLIEQRTLQEGRTEVEVVENGRHKRLSIPIEIKMLATEPDQETSVNLKRNDIVVDESSSSSRVSPEGEHTPQRKNPCNFLGKRQAWSEGQEKVIAVSSTVAFPQHVIQMKQETASDPDVEDERQAKLKHFAANIAQGSASRDEHLLNELSHLGATPLAKSPSNFASAMYNLKALTGEHQYSCEVCGRSFVQNHSLTRHMRTHTGERPYQCTQCGKAFIQNHSLTRHMRTHTGERPFPCTTCGRSFAEHHKLKSHVKTHTGERPFACDTCGKTFIERHTLLDHMKTHTGERNYACAICGKSFMERHKLKRHLRSHTGERPYTCTTCGKSFVQSHNLTQHMRIHTGEQPYPCSTCGKMFGERHKLERHLRSHAKNGPYACTTCGKRFVQSHRLARHVRLHSSEEQHPPQATQITHPPIPSPSQNPVAHSQHPPTIPIQAVPHALLHHHPSLVLPLALRTHFSKDMT